MATYPSDIILTGIPRSGTTLSCYLLNKLPDIVALNEPMKPFKYVGWDLDSIINAIQIFFAEQRQSICYHRTAQSRSVNGVIPDNFIGDIDRETGKRKTLINSTEITVDKSLDNYFKLVIKHPNFFTAILEKLVDHYDCYAIIRNPLSVLLSWNTVEMHVARGYAPAGEAFDDRLSKSLQNENDIHSRQLILLSWYYNKYRVLLPSDHIIRYEDIISSGGKALAPISANAVQLHEQLLSKNNSDQYNYCVNKGSLMGKLLEFKGDYNFFYNEMEIIDLI